MIFQRTSKLDGFTVIEVLTVTAILSILLVILTPVVSSARVYAKSAACTSNLRQTGACFNMYTIDNGGTYPHEDNGDTRPPFGKGWYVVLKQYADEKGIFICPSAKNTPDLFSYKMNSKLETEENPFFKVRGEVEAGRTILVFDGRIDNNGVKKAPKGTWNMVSDRHNKRANFLFLDNHVEGIEREFDRAGWKNEGGLVWEVE